MQHHISIDQDTICSTKKPENVGSSSSNTGAKVCPLCLVVVPRVQRAGAKTPPKPKTHPRRARQSHLRAHGRAAAHQQARHPARRHDRVDGGPGRVPGCCVEGAVLDGREHGYQCDVSGVRRARGGHGARRGDMRQVRADAGVHERPVPQRGRRAVCEGQSHKVCEECVEGREECCGPAFAGGREEVGGKW